MPMLDANDPAIWDQYPNGAIIRDRLGRVLTKVVACNTETGEVITYSALPIVAWWARVRWRRALAIGRIPINSNLLAVEGQSLRRHGFWPAPLTIEPRQWLHIAMD